MTTTVINWAWGSNQKINFNPLTDKLDFGWFQSEQFSISEANDSVVISIPTNNQTYTLTNVKLSQLSMNNIIANDPGASNEWNAAISNSSIQPTPAPTPEPAPTTTPTTTPVTEPTPTPISSQTLKIDWHWGQHQAINFNPITDKLDFGWMQKDQFTMTEVNGSVVISIPTNSQDYTLTNVKLSQLHSSNIISLDSGTTTKINGVITGDTTVTPTPEPTPIPDPVPTPVPTGGAVAYADSYNSTQIYTSGQTASVGNSVYQASWWTQGVDPSKDNSGNWKLLGYYSTTPVAPDAITGVYAVSTSDTSTLLMWDKAVIKGVGTISEYDVYENGQFLARTTDTSFKVTGLNPATNYEFSVVAVDEAGSSPASTPIHVTTDQLHTSANNQFFSPYIDMSLSTSQDLTQVVKDSGVDHLTLAFMLSSGKDQIGWGGTGSLSNDSLSNGTTMHDLITSVQKLGTDITISFGGANGQEPGLTFSSADALQKAYQSVIDTYHVNKLDFDIEGGAIANTAANHMRDVALHNLDAANPDLFISFTLPVLPTGLTLDGINLLKQAQADGVHIDEVNIMAMDYGANADSGDMGADAINSALSTIAQLKSIGLDAKVGITPMIGVNDVSTEVFTLQDAHQLLDFAAGNNDISSIHMWSLGRDNGGGAGSPWASPVNSGLEQNTYAFADIFNGL